mgnify:CR=1 FL=1
MDKKDSFEQLEGEIDEAKRDTLIKLSKAAWVVPAVATFGLSSLGSSSQAWAQAVPNGSTSS